MAVFGAQSRALCLRILPTTWLAGADPKGESFLKHPFYSLPAQLSQSRDGAEASKQGPSTLKICFH